MTICPKLLNGIYFELLYINNLFGCKPNFETILTNKDYYVIIGIIFPKPTI